MLDVGDPAPDFVVPLAHGDGAIEPFVLSERLHEAPIVLASFRGAFVPRCREAMRRLQSRRDRYRDLGATPYGLSVDTPFAHHAFRDRNGLEFGMLSDTNRRVVDAYGLATDVAAAGLYGVADRAVLVVDADCRVVHRWVPDPPSERLDLAGLEDAVASAAR